MACYRDSFAFIPLQPKLFITSYSLVRLSFHTIGLIYKKLKKSLNKAKEEPLNVSEYRPIRECIFQLVIFGRSCVQFQARLPTLVTERISLTILRNCAKNVKLSL
jgi:hypothetical protein